MVDAPRSRRRPRRQVTDEEYQLELLQRIADDVRALKTFLYWVVGLYVVGSILFAVIAFSA